MGHRLTGVSNENTHSSLYTFSPSDGERIFDKYICKEAAILVFLERTIR